MATGMAHVEDFVFKIKFTFAMVFVLSKYRILCAFLTTKAMQVIV